MNQMKIVLVDLDGTLCNGECFTVEDCKKAEPKKDIIEKINELYKYHFIIIYTARRNHLIPVTLDWLRKNGVYYHALSNNKIPGHFYIDIKNIKPEETDKLMRL